MRATPIALLWLAAIVSASAHAGDLETLRLDFDGDGRPDAVTLSTAPAAKDSRRLAVVRLGHSEYKADFFAAEGEIPTLNAIQIDRGNHAHPVVRRQLLLMTPEAGSCIYHVLALESGHLAVLLRFDSGSDCRAPEPGGNGTISTYAWQGFWFREERYRLTGSGTSLVKQPQDAYVLNVAGAAAKPLLLEDAGCSVRDVPTGQYLRLESFDARGNRYLVKAAGGACGWLPASDIESGQAVAELPKAG